MAMARMSDAERWEAIWRGAEEAVARLLGADLSDKSEKSNGEESSLAPVAGRLLRSLGVPAAA
jgi:hypothetical protein